MTQRQMKKGKSPTRQSAVSRKPSPKDVDAYMAGLPEDSRDALEKMRQAIRSVVPPEAVETISYGIPAFKHKKVLVWFAAFAHHCSLFPTAEVIVQFQDELKRYSPSKGTVHFPNGKPIPTGLIKKMVKARVVRAESRLR